ncbi:MAG: hypothetical protein M3R24_17310 [Chloroflexota bacterium]|nr:hypothetical protein [Chloroflexota bacterium]
MVVDDIFPHLSRWVQQHGWMEIGYDDYSRSFIRILDIGGLVWESNERYSTVDAALHAAEAELAVWMREQGFG